MGSNLSTDYFHIIVCQPSEVQPVEITDEVLTGRYSSLTAVVHSASYPLEKANRVAVYQWLVV